MKQDIYIKIMFTLLCLLYSITQINLVLNEIKKSQPLGFRTLPYTNESNRLMSVIIEGINAAGLCEKEAKLALFFAVFIYVLPKQTKRQSVQLVRGLLRCC